jgi:hypothetical protein
VSETIGLYGVFIEVGWTAIAYGCCMLLDMLMLNRAGFAYIEPRGAPTIEPRFWIGFKLRHVLLVPMAFLVQYLVRRRIVDMSTMWIVLGVLTIAYLTLLIRDLLGQRRPPAE